MPGSFLELVQALKKGEAAMNDTQSGKGQSPPRTGHVCPPWCCFTFDNIFRRLVQDPNRILRPYIKPGWTVLDIGPGMGYFTIPTARLVGDTGKVIAADLQQEMLDGVDHRAYKGRIARTRQSAAD